jgi:beta-aspartyl-peptidase (threonine type)
VADRADLAIDETGQVAPPVLLVHGGAGRRTAAEIGDAHQQAFRAAVEAALAAGWRGLAAGGDALTAVIEAVAALEDSGAMNAGRGSVRTATGTVEMDAAVMTGADRGLGAVAGVSVVRNPVRAARLVLADEQTVLRAGPQADRYAVGQGAETVGPDWFEASAVSRASVADPGAPAEHRVPATPAGPGVPATQADHTAQATQAGAGDRPDPPASDTVGAVAVDAAGHTAAATSTGGMPGQPPGRVGDSPVAGAGLWADDRTAALSATGVGDAFLRTAAAHHVHMLCRAGTALGKACRSALAAVGEVGGYGGLIAVTAGGAYAFSASGPLLIRGLVSAERAPSVRLFAPPAG